MSSIVEKMSAALDTRAATVNEWTARYRGESQFVLLTQEQRDALKNRLSSLSINYGALAVDLLNERLRLIGFTIDGTPDLNLWERWQMSGCSTERSRCNAMHWPRSGLRLCVG